MYIDYLTPSKECALLLVVALASTLIGFIKTLWFISLGYTLSISLFVVVLGSQQRKRPGGLNLYSKLYLLGALVWGVRLGLFIFFREFNTNYRASMNTQASGLQSVPLYKKFGIWSSVSLLYVSMFSPVVFGVLEANLRGVQIPIISYAGLGVLWFGVVVEAVADQQKYNFKSTHPKKFVNSGLYRWVRYPNYFGEILFWVGSFVAGMPAATQWWQWLVASIGLISIIFIMISSTKNLESKQGERYGRDPVYSDYCKRVPILVPGIPVYSLKNTRTYIG